MKIFWCIVGREIILSWRQGGGPFMGVCFFVIAVCLFAFGVGSKSTVLAPIGSGIIWVCALLASLLSLERLFQDDFEDGSLDLLLLADISLEAVILAKCLANWLLAGLPVLLVAPLLAMMLRIEPQALGFLMASLALGTPSLTFIGALGAALTLGSRRGGALLALLVLPLQIPILIFGAAGAEAALSGETMGETLSILAALLVLCAPLSLWATSMALQVAGD